MGRNKSVWQNFCGVNGYFTVEVSLIFPMIILLTAFLFYLTFFLYNRCVITQDSYMLAFRGSILCGKKADDVTGYVDNQIRQQSVQKYAGLYKLERKADADHRKVTVEARGSMRIPESFHFEIEKSAERICPVENIRQFRLMQKILKRAETGGTDRRDES